MALQKIEFKAGNKVKYLSLVKQQSINGQTLSDSKETRRVIRWCTENLRASISRHLSSPTRPIVAYLVTLASVVLATILRIAMDPALQDHHPFTLYFAAVVLAAWYGGLGPGICAIALSYFAADWFFISPRFEINWPRENLDEFLALIAFLFSGLAIAVTTSLMQQALRAARRKQQELEHEISVRHKAENDLRVAQSQLRQHADSLEEHVTERTRYLRETIRSLEGVCYHLAHDLRAPLRAMDGYTNLLLKECSTSLDDTGRSYAGKIVQATERMDLLIHGLMEYGRLGAEHFLIQPVEPKRVLDKLLSRLLPASQHARITIGTWWPELLANELLLETIFFHLLSNALKFVRLDVAPRVRVYAEDRETEVRIWVEDNGIGLPMQYADKIFGVFQRLHPAEPYPGIGIGLAIVAKAVARMNGTVGVESDPKKGSRFWFELPIATGSSTSQKNLQKLTSPLVPA